MRYEELKAHIASLAVDPTDPNTVYAAAVNGGLLKTTDGGQSWQAVTLPTPAEAPVITRISGLDRPCPFRCFLIVKNLISNLTFAMGEPVFRHGVNT